MPAVAPDISIIIPAKNGAPRIDRVLQSIFAQKTAFSFEVIVIDSGSTDETLEIVRSHPVRLHQIPPEEFSHSRTRNYGAQLSHASRYLVFLNQDALPCGDTWLENLVRSVESEPGLKAVCATELIENKTYFNVSGAASYVFRNSGTRGVHVIAANILEALPNLPKWQRRELFPFTTVCAIFDKQHFLDHPFDEKVPWGEDLYWAVRNSREGYAAGCTSLACVYHHHEYSEAEMRAIQTHTARLYKELFDCELAVQKEATSIAISMASGDPNMQAILNSMSWRITAPLRKVHTFLMRCFSNT